MQPVHIDCDTCSVRGPACGDCIVSVLLGPPGLRSASPPTATGPRQPVLVRGPGGLGAVGPGPGGRVELAGELLGGGPLPGDLDAEERRALAVLAAAGIVAHLRVVEPAAAPSRRVG